MSIHIARSAFALTTAVSLAACQTVDQLPTTEVTSDPSHDTSFTPTTEAPADLCEGGECNDYNRIDSDGCFECKWTCDANPECEGNETLENCPSQCSICGDGKITGDETCECGGDGEPCFEQTYQQGKPAEGTCYNCMLDQWCGDGVKNGAEACDTGGQSADCEAGCTKPICGDKITNYFFDEECEEGDLDCSGCRRVRRRVFVTSRLYCGNLGEYDPVMKECGEYKRNDDEAGGIGRGDERCRQLALNAVPPIENAKSMKAWLSHGTTDKQDPKGRFSAAKGETFVGWYVMVRGENEVLVARGWNDLIDGALENPIRVNEAGATIVKILQVWTNTNYDGLPLKNNCGAWASKETDIQGGHGLVSKINLEWSNSALRDCNAPARLYCFEDPDPPAP